MPLQITVQDLIMSHPMGQKFATDFYYAKVANRLLRQLSKNPAKQGLDEDVMIKMALKTALYF